MLYLLVIKKKIICKDFTPYSPLRLKRQGFLMLLWLTLLSVHPFSVPRSQGTWSPFRQDSGWGHGANSVQGPITVTYYGQFDLWTTEGNRSTKRKPSNHKTQTPYTGQRQKSQRYESNVQTTMLSTFLRKPLQFFCRILKYHTLWSERVTSGTVGQTANYWSLFSL